MPLSTKNSNISRLQSLWEPDQDAPAVRTLNNRYGGSKTDESTDFQENLKDGRSESGKSESGKSESGKSESGKSESGKSESRKSESGKSDKSRSEKSEIGFGSRVSKKLDSNHSGSRKSSISGKSSRKSSVSGKSEKVESEEEIFEGHFGSSNQALKINLAGQAPLEIRETEKSEHSAHSEHDNSHSRSRSSSMKQEDNHAAKTEAPTEVADSEAAVVASENPVIGDALVTLTASTNYNGRYKGDSDDGLAEFYGRVWFAIYYYLSRVVCTRANMGEGILVTV